MTTPTYTVEEVAAQLRVDPLTIYRAIRAGRFEVLRVGRQIRITPEQFNAFTQPNQAKPKD